MQRLTPFRRRLVGLVIILALLAVVYAARVPLLRGMAAWLDVSEKPQPADVVLFLPGDQQTRPFVAAALVKQGYAPAVLVPSNLASADVAEGITLPNHEITRQILQARGLTESQITILPTETTSTWADAEALEEHLKDRSSSTVLVVTHHYHTRRSRWVLRQVLDEQEAQLVFIAAPTDEWTLDNWWRTKAGLNAVLTEYLKFVYYLLRYGDWRAWTFLFGALAAITALKLLRRKDAEQEPEAVVEGS